MSEPITVEVDGHHLRLTNLDKVLYPQAGVTKGEVIDYYTRISPVLLPHLAERPLTVKRYPNGVDAAHFFEKNVSRGTPDWVRTVRLSVPGSTMNRDTIDFVVVDSLATLVRLANLAALELHIPQWRVGGAGPDIVVFDLDPGPPATLAHCCTVALRLREVLAADGLTAFAKTSGSKGLHVSAPVIVTDPGQTGRYAHSIARRLESEDPGLVVSQMSKSLRPGKVFVDWSQNSPAKTTVAPYSLRARAQPTVSTPIGWEEVAAGTRQFAAAEVLDRVDAFGDLFAGVLDRGLAAELPEPPGSVDVN